VVEVLGDGFVGLPQNDMLVDDPDAEVVAHPATDNPVLVAVERSFAITTLIALTSVADEPPLDARGCELQVWHDLARLEATFPDSRAAALRALFGWWGLDLLVHLQLALALASFSL